MPGIERPWRRVLASIEPPEFSWVPMETTDPSGPAREPRVRFYPRVGPARPRWRMGPVPEWVSILAERDDETAGVGTLN